MKTPLALLGASALFWVIPGLDITTGFFLGAAALSGIDRGLKKFEDPYAPKKIR